MDYEPLILVAYNYTMAILCTNMPIMWGGSNHGVKEISYRKG
jgi:hypothetical protein